MAVLARILIVEDDAIQADLMARFLDSHGFYVEHAATGLDAVRKMLAGWFDIVLMDYSIPDLDGVAVGHVIKDLTRTHGRPRLIAMTASPDRLHEREGTASSVFDAVVGKPWNPDHLVGLIRLCHEAAPPTAYSRAETALTRPGRSRPAAREPGERVLIIDDDGPLRTILAQSLDRAGYLVEEAQNGLEGLRLVIANAYDAVVVDFHMPEIDGLATGRLIYDLLDGVSRPRLIALTSAPDSLSEKETGHLSVFDDIIAKNRGFDTLFAAIRQSIDYKTQRSFKERAEVVRLPSILRLGPDRPSPGLAAP